MIPFLNIICIFAKESCLSRVATTDDSCCRTYKEKETQSTRDIEDSHSRRQGSAEDYQRRQTE